MTATLDDTCGCPDGKGHAHPRIWTPPLRELTPDTTDGFRAVAMAKELGLNLLPWQRWFLLHALEQLPDGRPRFRTVLLLIARQNGKLLDDDTPVWTADGWCRHGDLAPGDAVYDQDGRPSIVLYVTNPETVPAYRVTLTDGTSLVAGAEHNWTVRDRRFGNGAWQVRTTAEIAAAGLLMPGSRDGSRDHRWRVPPRPVVQSPDADLPLDPYLLGTWLGDGAAAGGRITGSASKRAHWLPLFTAAGYAVREGDKDISVHGLTPVLRELGVLGNKHVPNDYLTASSEQRLALLRGLLDTDGHVSTGGQVDMTCKPWQAEAIAFLARSLGQRPTVRPKAVQLPSWDEPRTYYRVTFTPSGGLVPFTRPEHVNRLRTQRADRSALSISSIEPTGERVSMRCIGIDSPTQTYLAGSDLVPTHNTTLAALVLLLWLFGTKPRLILGAAQSLAVAEECWDAVVSIALGNDALSSRVARVVRTNGKKALMTAEGSRYLPIAATSNAARGFSPSKTFIDELREQYGWQAWAAIEKSMIAQSDGMLLGASNAGTREAVVLTHLRSVAIDAIETGDDAVRVGLFEWSADPSLDIADAEGRRQANPSVGYTIEDSSLVTGLRTDPPEIYRAEVLCQTVESLSTALDATSWLACGGTGKDALWAAASSGNRRGLHLGIAVTRDADGVAVVAAARDGDLVRVQTLRSWVGPDAATRATSEIPGMVRKLRPRTTAWVTPGSGAALEPAFARRLPTRLVPIRGADTPGICVLLAQQVSARTLRHGDDPLLTAQSGAAGRSLTRDGWLFTPGPSEQPVHALFAAAAAVRQALITPRSAEDDTPEGD